MYKSGKQKDKMIEIHGSISCGRKPFFWRVETSQLSFSHEKDESYVRQRDRQDDI